MPKPSVAAGVTAKMLEFALERGADRCTLLAQSGIDPEALHNFDARIPFKNHIALLRAAKQQCQDPAFVLHYGDSVNLAEVSVVGLIGYASETMLDAFVQLSRYSRLILDLDLGPAARFTLAREADGPWIIDHRPRPNDYPELTEVAFSQMVNGTRRFGDTPFVREVQVTHLDPGYRLEYERILGAPVMFGSVRNAMRIDPAWLSHKIAAQPRYVFGVLTRHADTMIEQLEAQKTMRGRVEQILLPILHTGDVGMSDISKLLGCSRDTLYRSLKAEGITFTHVLDELRYQLALDYLQGGRVSVNETAYLVGFSDPAAFSRAFKRRHGQRPGQCQKMGRE
jgi:AraC-like DNA-binding protein